MIVDIQQLIEALCREQNEIDHYHAYVDRESGEILCLYEDPFGSPYTEEEEAQIENLIKSDPERYVYIPPAGYPVRRALLEEFIASKRAEETGISGRSIREWIDVADDLTRLEFYAFEEQALQEMVNDFLLGNGIECEQATV